MLREDIKLEINKYNPENVIFWIFAPYAIDFVNGFGKFFTIYHCTGNFSAEKENLLRKKTVLKMESDLTERSDMVVAQTKSLTRRFESSGKKMFYLPSAANFDRYSERQNNDMDISEFHNIKTPRVGIIGYFNDIFYDIDLLEYLMDEKRDWSFVFIGPLSKNAKRFKKLTRKKNACFLGAKGPDSIPAYISGVDIGIIPYKINDYMKEVSPNKFYEYIACGKPVVSTELPDIKEHTDVLKIANNKYKFLEGMEHFLSKKAGETVRKRAFIIAQEYSFDRYLDELSRIIKRLMSESVLKKAEPET
jgi:glycosyltransferase involved in cell wall biosynthesis